MRNSLLQFRAVCAHNLVNEMIEKTHMDVVTSE